MKRFAMILVILSVSLSGAAEDAVLSRSLTKGVIASTSKFLPLREDMVDEGVVFYNLSATGAESPLALVKEVGGMVRLFMGLMALDESDNWKFLKRFKGGSGCVVAGTQDEWSIHSDLITDVLSVTFYATSKEFDIDPEDDLDCKIALVEEVSGIPVLSCGGDCVSLGQAKCRNTFPDGLGPVCPFMVANIPGDGSFRRLLIAGEFDSEGCYFLVFLQQGVGPDGVFDRIALVADDVPITF